MFGHIAHDYKNAYFIESYKVCATFVNASTVPCCSRYMEVKYDFLSLCLWKWGELDKEKLRTCSMNTNRIEKKKASGPHMELCFFLKKSIKRTIFCINPPTLHCEIAHRVVFRDLWQIGTISQTTGYIISKSKSLQKERYNQPLSMGYHFQ